jgi:hypothetical protein
VRLAGDAAHQTGPIRMQSMNMGFREGADLAAKLTRILSLKYGFFCNRDESSRGINNFNAQLVYLSMHHQF